MLVSYGLYEEATVYLFAIKRLWDVSRASQLAHEDEEDLDIKTLIHQSISIVLIYRACY